MPRLDFPRLLSPVTGLQDRAGLRFQDYWRRVQSVRRSALAGYWPLWETSGATVADYSGRGNPGTLVNASYGNLGMGDGHQCLAFTSDPAYGDLGDPAVLRLTSAGTVSVWRWMNSLTVPGNRLILWKGSLLDRSNNYAIYEDTLGVVFEVDSTLRTAIFYSNASMSIGVWYHYVLTWDAVNVQGFINVSSVGTGLTRTPNTATYPLYISDNGAYYANGRVSHLAIWNERLTLPEIKILYGA